MSDVRVVSADVEFHRRAFATPLRLSSGTITDITEARAQVTVEAGGRTAEGRGAIYLSDLWAWPDPALAPAERDAGMRAFARQAADRLSAWTDGPAHPLELGLRLHERVLHADDAPPPLARLVSASPFDAAIHDAAGRLFGVSAFRLYDQPAPAPSADSLFPDHGAVAAIGKMLRPTPSAALDATLVVGKGDDLATLEPWVRGRGYRFLKLKIGGVDPLEDAARTAAVYREAIRLGCAAPRLTVDANCLTPDPDAVAVYLDRLSQDDPDAFAALEHVEQPTARDIARAAYDWRAIAARRPLLVDEGLIGFDSLTTAEAQGWNGLALKTCKGHSFVLTAAAWAHARGWTLTVMDLTNPGLAAIHSALLAAHLPGVDAIELNAAQYTPDAHAEWLPRLQSLLTPDDGRHRIPSPAPIGLGTAL